MGRVSPAHAAALGAPVLYSAFFAEFHFQSGVTRFWSGDATINADLGDGSVAWLGGAYIAGIKTSGEGEATKARQFVFTLNCVDRAYLQLAQQTQYRKRPIRLWWNLMNSSFTTVTFPYEMENARMDTFKAHQDDETLTLVLTAESHLLNLFRPNRCLMTPEDRKKLYPGDEIYRYVKGLPGSQLPWGLEGVRGSNTGAHDGALIQERRYNPT